MICKHKRLSRWKTWSKEEVLAAKLDPQVRTVRQRVCLDCGEPIKQEMGCVIRIPAFEMPSR
jgi:hypothetical protein